MLLKINLLLFLLISFLFFRDYNESSIIKTTFSSIHELRIERAQILVNYNKDRYDKLLFLYGKDNKLTLQSKLDYELSKIDLEIEKIKK